LEAKGKSEGEGRSMSMHENAVNNASRQEKIAAAFVLNRQEYLPEAYDDMLEAWDRLGTEWQQYVRLIKRDYMHLIDDQ